MNPSNLDLDHNQIPRVSAAGEGADSYGDARAEAGSHPEIITGAEAAKHILLGRGARSIGDQGNVVFRDVVRSRKAEVC